MPRRVVITAMGIVSPLGIGCAQTDHALRSARDCITPVTSFDVTNCRSKAAGHAPKLPRHSPHLHPASRMMIDAARQTHTADPHFTPQLAIIGTTSGGMSHGEHYYRTQAHPTPRHSALLTDYPAQAPVLHALRALHTHAPAQIIANACASGTNAIGHAFHLIRSGLHDTILAGGYDTLSELVFVGFDTLQASTTEKIRPFCHTRTGLLLGEGAALLTLEEHTAAQRRNAPILAELTGYGISTDNHHLTQPHPSGIGPQLAMTRALEDAHLHPTDIHYINAHGTATHHNDHTEGTAIANLFGPRVPVSSTKGMTGHTLGAAGAVEAIISILALRGQYLPPNINYRQPDPAFDINIIANTPITAQPRTILSNSFGFGGTNATIILQAY